MKLSKLDWAASAIGEENWCEVEFHAGGEVARKPRFWAWVSFAVEVISRSSPGPAGPTTAGSPVMQRRTDGVTYDWSA